MPLDSTPELLPTTAEYCAKRRKPRKVWSAAGPWTTHSGYTHPWADNKGRVRSDPPDRLNKMTKTEVQAMDQAYKAWKMDREYGSEYRCPQQDQPKPRWMKPRGWKQRGYDTSDDEVKMTARDAMRILKCLWSGMTIAIKVY